MKYIIYVAALLFAVSCTNKQEKEMNQLEDKASELTQEARQNAEKQWEATKQSAKELRNDIDAKVQNLEAEIKTASNDGKAALEKQKQELEAWGQRVDKRLDNMGSKIADGWENALKETNEFFKEVKEAIKS